jgi:hypothetical protein
MDQPAKVRWAKHVAAHPSEHRPEAQLEALQILSEAIKEEPKVQAPEKPKVRITLEKEKWERAAARTEVKEFTDVYAAQDWFIHDSYFAEDYTRKATWERLDLS